MRLPRSLQGRLLVLVLGMVVIVWLATAAITWLDARHELDELLDSHLAQAAALLVVQQSHEAAEGEQELDSPTLHRYAPKVAFQVFHEGRLTLRSANAPVAAMVDPAEDFRAGFRTASFEQHAWRVFAAHGGEQDVQVYVAEQLDSREAILWAVLRSTLWPMLVALPILSVAAWWAVRRGVAPIRLLGSSLAQRQPQALDPITVAGAPAEMAPMMTALNGLFQRIAALMEAERRFTADAAHELRTPIAAIRAQAQVAQGEADDAARRHALGATLAGCDRATHLVEQLLTLSRLESGTAPVMAPVKLGPLVRQVVAELAPQAVQKGQTIELDAAEDDDVLGDATLLAVLVRNLVDNAIRYSPSGASVSIAVTSDGARRCLRVEDSGPGLSEADRGRVGERFFRVIGSGATGTGLGWSIVRSIAAAHRATVALSRSARYGGLAAEVAWPASVCPPRKNPA